MPLTHYENSQQKRDNHAHAGSCDDWRYKMDISATISVDIWTDRKLPGLVEGTKTNC